MHIDPIVLQTSLTLIGIAIAIGLGLILADEGQRRRWW